MQTRSRTVVSSLLLALALILTGCTSKTKTADNEKTEELADAPLGSRIKRKAPANPMSESERQQLELNRARQGAVQNGLVNDPSKGTRIRQ